MRLWLLVTVAFSAWGQNGLIPGTPVLDRPTLTALGIKLPVTGDTNYNAAVSVRYRKQGAAAWKSAQPLFRVHPESIGFNTVAPHFAGSILDLRPATTYDVELRVTDIDTSLDQTFTLTAATRPVPGYPATPRQVPVSNVTQMNAAFAAAQPGDVITLADGIYTGSFFNIPAAGNAVNPIVIRGTTRDGTILDGAGCTGCNVLEVYGGGYVTIENLTIRNAERALRFQANGATGNVVRGIRTTNTVQAIGSKPDQTDFYIADNVFEGRLVWPLVVPQDGALHASDTGVAVQGHGHVVAHNRLSGFGDAIDIGQSGSRAIDVIGNDVLWSYDNGIELDGGEGNVRALRNRLANVFMPISVQPVIAGPGYIIRNRLTNAVDEPFKFHALATSPPQEPNGVFAYQNTSLASMNALRVQTPLSSHHFAFLNNILMAPATTGIVVDWTAPIDDGVFNYNGYFPDGPFYFNRGGYQGYPNFASLQAAGFEQQGTLLNGGTFASGVTPSANYSPLQPAPDLSLASNSAALDRGVVLPNINDAYRGLGPDMGALELGCPAPGYGPRPPGVDESNEVIGCETTGSAAYVRTDLGTRGSWRNIYGGQGYSIAGNTRSLPAWATLASNGTSTVVWSAVSSSFRALQKAPPSTQRISAAWTAANSFTFNLNVTDINARQVALYFLDWNSVPARQQLVEVLDWNGEVLYQQTLSSFSSGVYLVWNVTGRVQIRVTGLNGAPLVSGIFLN
ncbi:MAG TPA: hypothetical protein VM120_00445 [Bryobacteraceae bacterium]|nr:hypothetical protein [Bryobacteraceae bacterium]